MGSEAWIAYLGMGGNLPWRGAPPEQTLRDAVSALAEIGTVEAVSSLWRTAPVGPVQEQPNFVNAAVKLRTGLAPEELLAQLLELERRFGRARGALDKGPRTLDLDVLLMEDAVCLEPVVVHSARLQLPHPEMHRRRFVLAPLGEIAPDARHPVLGRTVREMLLGLPSEDQTGEQVVRLAGRAAS